MGESQIHGNLKPHKEPLWIQQPDQRIRIPAPSQAPVAAEIICDIVLSLLNTYYAQGIALFCIDL